MRVDEKLTPEEIAYKKETVDLEAILQEIRGREDFLMRLREEDKYELKTAYLEKPYSTLEKGLYTLDDAEKLMLVQYNRERIESLKENLEGRLP